MTEEEKKKMELQKQVLHNKPWTYGNIQRYCKHEH